MSYIKNCNTCGDRISLRQMAGGQWVAFEAGTDIPHSHGKVKNLPQEKVEVKVKHKTEKKPKVTAMQFVDRSGEIYSLSRIPKEWLDLTPMNLTKFFKKIIEKERKVMISYVDRNRDETTREIYPFSLVEGLEGGKGRSKSMKVVGYCNLRKDYRTFLLASITEVLAENKIPQSFLNKFKSLSEHERREIISGSKFYGSNTLHFSVDKQEDLTSSDHVQESISQDLENKVIEDIKESTSNRSIKESSSNYDIKETYTNGLITWILIIGFLALLFG